MNFLSRRQYLPFPRWQEKENLLHLDLRQPERRQIPRNNRQFRRKSTHLYRSWKNGFSLKSSFRDFRTNPKGHLLFGMPRGYFLQWRTGHILLGNHLPKTGPWRRLAEPNSAGSSNRRSGFEPQCGNAFRNRGTRKPFGTIPVYWVCGKSIHSKTGVTLCRTIKKNLTLLMSA